MQDHQAPFDLNFGERPGSVAEILLGKVMALSFHHLADLALDTQIFSRILGMNQLLGFEGIHASKYPK